MSTVGEVKRRLKQAPSDLKLVVMIDGQYYDVNTTDIRSVWVKSEKDWNNVDCYGIADEEDPNSFQVLTIE